MQLVQLSTGTWLDHVITRDLLAVDSLNGGGYGQFRAAIGGCYNLTDRAENDELLEQIPNTLEKLVGDIQGMPPGLQAKMAARGFAKSAPPTKLDYFFTAGDAIVEISRRSRGGEDAFAPLFAVNWTTAYPSVRIIMPTADAETAAQWLRSAITEIVGTSPFVASVVEMINGDFTRVQHNVALAAITVNAACYRSATTVSNVSIYPKAHGGQGSYFLDLRQSSAACQLRGCG